MIVIKENTPNDAQIPIENLSLNKKNEDNPKLDAIKYQIVWGAIFGKYLIFWNVEVIPQAKPMPKNIPNNTNSEPV